MSQSKMEKAGTEMEGKFDPHATTHDEDALHKFLHAPVTNDLDEVPGIGPSHKETLVNLSKVTGGKFADVTNTSQLFGKFMDMRTDNMNGREHCDAFWNWLKDAGINSQRNQIVRAVAEKINVILPDVYDASIYSHHAEKKEKAVAQAAANAAVGH